MWLFALFLGVLPAFGAPAPDGTPPELRPWVDWVAAELPDLPCARDGGGTACAWPSSLDLSAYADGATFRLQVRLDREGEVALPGGRGAWPQPVLAGGKPVSVLDAGGQPVVRLPAGEHAVDGQLSWTRRPVDLPVPSVIAAVRLRLDGAEVPRPMRDQGSLRLGAPEVASERPSRLDVEVARRLHDSVPAQVETHVTLRASGEGREVDLGPALLPGTRPITLDADIPARFSSEGHLVVGVRPGTWVVRFTAVHPEPFAAIQRAASSEPWPELEFWAVDADESARSARVEGLPGVDSARAATPAAWKSLPTYLARPGEQLRFTELRRGDPEPGPNTLQLSRELWLDLDGGGFTFRDQLSGVIQRDWRLDAAEPLRLGAARVDGQPVVITTQDDGARGVELRTTHALIEADGHLPRSATLPAVGWSTDVETLAATLHLPPGWRLLAAGGVDRARGAWLDAFTLFDLFFLLLLGLATGRLFGWRWGLAALLGLTLGRHEATAPQWMWAALLVATLGWKAPPRLHTAATWFHGGAAVVLWLLLVPFLGTNLQDAMFPSASSRYDVSRGGYDHDVTSVDRFAEFTADQEEMPQAARKRGYAGESMRSAPSSDAMKSRQQANYAQLVDPGAITQTGPGVPTWRFTQVNLQWDGPVGAAHTLTLWLLPPLGGLGLALLRAGLLLALAIRLTGRALPLHPNRGAATAATAAITSLALLLASPAAQASPDPQLLRELKQRVAQSPACGDRCVSTSALHLTVEGDELRLSAEVQAGADVAWTLPGPRAVWQPTAVTSNGRPLPLRGRGDGSLQARLPAGVHRIEARGPLGPEDAHTLQLGQPAQRVTLKGEGYTLDGVRSDGSAEGTLQLSRVVAGARDASAVEAVTPWLHVEREITLGLTWEVHTTVRRLEAARVPVSVRIPLLPGESITDGSVEARDDAAMITLAADQPSVTWASTLPITTSLTLRAPDDVAWSEVWRLGCSPIFSCEAEGIPPVSHTRGGAWMPTWRPWSGDEVTLHVARPPATEGDTTTLERADLDVRVGRRTLSATLNLNLRSSQGGTLPLTLPAGAALQSLTVDGATLPARPDEDGVLLVPYAPGSHEVSATWQQDEGIGLRASAPRIGLGASAVNARVNLSMPESRWILATPGPAWGPVVLLWPWLLIVLGTALLLARVPHSPLRAWQWALLLAGLTQLPVVAQAIPIGWLLLLGLRRHVWPSHAYAHNLAQLGFVAFGVAALITLFIGVQLGLLMPPEAQISGDGSTAYTLHWYTDRVASHTPSAAVYSLPAWAWRGLHLVWALWLAESLIRWLRDAWAALREGGLWRWREKAEAAG